MRECQVTLWQRKKEITFLNYNKKNEFILNSDAIDKMINTIEITPIVIIGYTYMIYDYF